MPDLRLVPGVLTVILTFPEMNQEIFLIDPRNGPGLDPSDDICFVPALNPPVPGAATGPFAKTLSLLLLSVPEFTVSVTAFDDELLYRPFL